MGKSVFNLLHMKKYLICLLLPCVVWSCNLFEVRKIDQEPVAVSDTLMHLDSLLAHDSAVADNAQVKDTALLPPSQTIKTGNVQPEELMRFAESLVGIRYVYGSTNPKVGFDCSGFITYVFNHFNIPVPRSSIDFTNVGTTIPVAEAKRGDIILFTGTNPAERHVGHMGLVVSNQNDSLNFIHSTSGKAMGVTITPLSKYYQSRFVRISRIFP
jgi:cell wall-associated NlpC family hydrolase